jgi:hypothetical protein
MPEVVADLVHLPLGSHCVSFHVSREEAADHAVQFISGSPPDVPASYWVGDPELASYYNEKLAELHSDHVGCVHVLPGEQVEPSNGKLRPVAEIKEFVGAHPDGLSGAGETLSDYLTGENAAEHMEYEAWFDAQPRAQSRFMCPYDLRKLPASRAPSMLRELGTHHSHVVLSASAEPAVRLLQMFVFGREQDLPPQLADNLRWAREHELIRTVGPGGEFELTEAGEEIVGDWSKVATIDW